MNFYLYPYKLTDDYYIVGTGNKNFSIKKGYFGRAIINDFYYTGSWIITPKSIYGNKGKIIETNYFYIDRKTDKVYNFYDLYTFNKFLQKNNLSNFESSGKEKILNLMYDNGRNRKFK